MANYTQRAILQTFENMLVEMPFEKITVSAIVVRCEISSNTFYYHFRDIYDLLDVWLKKKQAEFLEFKDPREDFVSLLKKILHQMQDNSQIVYHIFDSISRDRMERYVFTTAEGSFYHYIQEKAEGMNLPETTLRAISGFCCYSILGFVLKFIWMRMETDVDSSVDALMDIFGGMLEYAMMRANGSDIPPEPE